MPASSEPPFDDVPASPSADLELVRAARRGQKAATRALAERLACIPAMVRNRERQLSAPLSEEERLDVAQETVAAVWAKLDRFRAHAPLEAWIYGFVLREHYKALSRRRRVPSTPGVEDPQVESEPVGPAEDEYELIHESLQMLDSTTAEIVRLKHFEDLTFVEIASEIDMPTNTVKTRYYRGISKLRSRLRPFWKEVHG